jgi:hypothetical protein
MKVIDVFVIVITITYTGDICYHYESTLNSFMGNVENKKQKKKGK